MIIERHEGYTRTQFQIEKSLGICNIPPVDYKFVREEIRPEGEEDPLSPQAHLTYMEQYGSARRIPIETIRIGSETIFYAIAIARTRKLAEEGSLTIPFEEVTPEFLVEMAQKVNEEIRKR